MSSWIRCDTPAPWCRLIQNVTGVSIECIIIRYLCADAKMQSWVVTGWHGMWTLMTLHFPSLSDKVIIISLSGSDTGECFRPKAEIFLHHLFWHIQKMRFLTRRRRIWGGGSGPFARNPPFVSFGSATTDLRWKLHVAARRARLRRTAYGKCFRLWERPNSSKPPYGKSFGRTPYTLGGGYEASYIANLCFTFFPSRQPYGRV